jgi:murein DD-endopeptidase MepM/ murein hydrolase activator NlpD
MFKTRKIALCSSETREVRFPTTVCDPENTRHIETAGNAFETGGKFGFVPLPHAQPTFDDALFGEGASPWWKQPSSWLSESLLTSLLLLSLAVLLSVREYYSFNALEDSISSAGHGRSGNSTGTKTIFSNTNSKAEADQAQSAIFWPSSMLSPNIPSTSRDAKLDVIERFLRNHSTLPSLESQLSPRSAEENALLISKGAVVRHVVEVKSGDTLSSILGKFRIKPQDTDAISKKLAHAQNLKCLQVGQTITVEVSADTSPRLMRLNLKGKKGNNIIASRDGRTYKLTLEKRKLKTITRDAHITIKHNLAYSASLEGVPQGVVAEVQKILRLVGINNLNSRDSLGIVYEEDRDESTDRVVGERVVRYVFVTTNGATKELYNWGSKDSFYNEKGASAVPAFLELPFRSSNVRISSRFGYRRHPILGITRMHCGVDFAARYGTDVFAAAEGVVVRAGRNGNYGLYVKIRHSNGLETTYAHLCSIYVCVGDRVTKMNRIGRVGCSGLASGPHLHHEVICERKFVDPQKHYKVTARLTGNELRRFNQMKARLAGKIACLKSTTQRV